MSRSLRADALLHLSEHATDRHLKLLRGDASGRDNVFGNVLKSALEQFRTLIQQPVEAADKFDGDSFQRGKTSVVAKLKGGHPNLSLGCVETAKVEAPAVVSMMRDGGLRLSVNVFPEAA